MNKRFNLIRKQLSFIRTFYRSCIFKILEPIVFQIMYTNIYVWGNKERLKIDPSAKMVNTLFNTMSGKIEIGEFTFAGHNVSIITGTHEYHKILKDRMYNWKTDGNDIIIGKGVWLGSNSVIIGPCNIGDNSVIAAGAVVISDVLPNTIVAGVPAKIVKEIKPRC